MRYFPVGRSMHPDEAMFELQQAGNVQANRQWCIHEDFNPVIRAIPKVLMVTVSAMATDLSRRAFLVTLLSCCLPNSPHNSIIYLH